jgi:hypothetical protein
MRENSGFNRLDAFKETQQKPTVKNIWHCAAAAVMPDCLHAVTHNAAHSKGNSGYTLHFWGRILWDTEKKNSWKTKKQATALPQSKAKQSSSSGIIELSTLRPQQISFGGRPRLRIDEGSRCWCPNSHQSSPMHHISFFLSLRKFNSSSCVC